MRAPTTMPTTMRLECEVPGCGEVAEIPVVYRLEVVPGALPGRTGSLCTRVVVDIEATLDLEAPLRVHLDEHAAHAEVGLEHDDDPMRRETSPNDPRLGR